MQRGESESTAVFGVTFREGDISEKAPTTTRRATADDMPSKFSLLQMRLENMRSLMSTSALMSGFAMSILFSTRTDSTRYPYAAMAWIYQWLMMIVASCNLYSLVVNCLVSYFGTRFLAYGHVGACEQFLTNTSSAREYSVLMPQLSVICLLVALANKTFEMTDATLASSVSLCACVGVFLCWSALNTIHRSFEKATQRTLLRQQSAVQYTKDVERGDDDDAWGRSSCFSLLSPSSLWWKKKKITTTPGLFVHTHRFDDTHRFEAPLDDILRHDDKAPRHTSEKKLLL